LHAAQEDGKRSFLIGAEPQGVSQAASGLNVSGVDFVVLQRSHQDGVVSFYDQMGKSGCFVTESRVRAQDFFGFERTG
jgi:hypothetical protein